MTPTPRKLSGEVARGRRPWEVTKRLYKDHTAKVGNLGQGLKVRVIKILSEHCPDLWKGLQKKGKQCFRPGKRLRS